jgi:hypothetical protein
VFMMPDRRPGARRGRAFGLCPGTVAVGVGFLASGWRVLAANSVTRLLSKPTQANRSPGGLECALAGDGASLAWLVTSSPRPC